MHLIPNRLDHASWKDRKLLAGALKPVYAAPSAETAVEALGEFKQSAWGRKYPNFTAAWRRGWDRVIPFFTSPPTVRRMAYTANAIESIHSHMRTVIKTRGHCPDWRCATSPPTGAARLGSGSRQ